MKGSYADVTMMIPLRYQYLLLSKTVKMPTFKGPSGYFQSNVNYCDSIAAT